jgi:hypothetical protein
MKKSLVLIGLFCLAGVVPALAQTKTVTNSDLEKYRQQRLQAQREYRENYEKWGFPSPEELERRNEKSKLEMQQLSEKLLAERLESESMQMQRELAAQRDRLVTEPVEVGTYSDGYFPGYGSLYYANQYRGRRRGQTQYGYYAGGQFWPKPRPDLRLRPAFRPQNRVFINPRPRH